jgi:hypothetical protein
MAGQAVAGGDAQSTTGSWLIVSTRDLSVIASARNSATAVLGGLHQPADMACILSRRSAQRALNGVGGQRAGGLLRIDLD